MYIIIASRAGLEVKAPLRAKGKHYYYMSVRNEGPCLIIQQINTSSSSDKNE